MLAVNVYHGFALNPSPFLASRHARGGRGGGVPNEVCEEGGRAGDTRGSATNGSPKAPQAPKWKRETDD